jgi:hypothetical protein
MGYLIFDQKPGGKGFVKAFSNRKLVSEFTGISYDTLTHHFSRNWEVWHYYEGPDIMVIHYEGMEKGRQGIHFKEKSNKRGKFG